MVYTYYMVYVTFVLQFINWCQRAASEKAKGLRLHLKGPRLLKWFLEAALQLKMYIYIKKFIILILRVIFSDIYEKFKTALIKTALCPKSIVSIKWVTTFWTDSMSWQNISSNVARNDFPTPGG